jgi:hypothetical protein
MSRDKQRERSIANKMCAVESAIEPRGQERFRVTSSNDSSSNHLITKIEHRSNSIGNENIVKESEPATKSMLGSVGRIHSKYLITNHRFLYQY